MKKKSFVNEILVYLLILTLILAVILGIFIVSSYYVLEDEINDATSALTEIYKNEFKNNIEDMDTVLTRLSMQGVDLELIGGKDADKRILSAVSLSNYMQDLMYSNDTVDILTVYDSNYGINIDAIKVGFDYNHKSLIKAFIASEINSKTIHNNQWDFVDIEGDMYIYKILFNGSRGIGAFTNAKNLLNFLSSQELADRIIVLGNNKGTVGKIIGAPPEDLKVGDSLQTFNSDEYKKNLGEVVKEELYVTCFTSRKSVLFQTHSSMIIVAISVGIALVFMGYILLFTQRQIALPMHFVIGQMKKIKNGQYESRIIGSYRTKEFDMLQEATNQMVDEIVGLKIQSYEKRLELLDIELKSIRLQLRPHFFLNALSTIASLSNQNKSEEIRHYIDAFSKNVRYMFSVGFRTVSIKNELKHVENYIKMQEFKYPGCTFYLIDLPSELEDWEVPQMIVHSFVENFFKYAIAIDTTRMLLIKVTTTRYQGEEMLLIEIEDDGKGYPEEVIRFMKGDNVLWRDDGTRTGLHSVKRMMELMYERESLIIISNQEPSGCLNKIYIPKVTKHQVRKNHD